MLKKTGVLTLTFAILSAQALADADAILGKWYTADDASRVQIYKEKNDNGAERYFGKITWLKDPLYEEDDPEAGEPLRDRENPNEELQDRPLIGLKVLKNFQYNEDEGIWDSGTIYDPENGKTYKCKITLVKDDSLPGGRRLDVRGYIGVPLLGRTTEWRPVPKEDLEDGNAV